RRENPPSCRTLRLDAPASSGISTPFELDRGTSWDLRGTSGSAAPCRGCNLWQSGDNLCRAGCAGEPACPPSAPTRREARGFRGDDAAPLDPRLYFDPRNTESGRGL